MASPSDNPLKRLIREIHRRSLWQVLGIFLLGGWVAFEVVQTLTEGLGLPEWFPAFAIVLLIIGLPIVLATAFVQEGGPVRDGEDLDVAAPAAPPGGASSLFTWRNAILGGVAALALLSGVGVGWVLFGDEPSSVAEVEERPAIAILPFENMSGAPEDEYFTDGMHDEILTRLSKIAGLRVISRTSVLGYENPTRNLREIAQELGVGYIGEGTVRRAQDNVRITVQLIDAETDEYLWADTYDRELSPGAIFDIQSDVAQRIAEALSTELTEEEAIRVADRPTESQEAYDLYLRGRDYWARPGQQAANWEIAEGLYERAIGLDPDFALARAKLSFLHGRTYWLSYDISEDRIDAQRYQSLEALRLQPDLPEAHFAEAYYDYVQGDVNAALEGFRIAQEGAPNDPETSQWIGYIYRRVGDWDAWERTYQRTIQLNPRDIGTYYNLGALTLRTLRRFPEAIAALDRALELAPDFSAAAVRKGDYFVRWLGQADTLRAVLDSLPTNDFLGARRDLALWDRDSDRLLEILAIGPDVWEAQSVISPRPLLAAWAHRLRGDEEAARLAFDSARVMLDSISIANPNDFRVHSAWGFTYAGLGRVAEAVQSASRYVSEGTGSSPGDVYYTRGYQRWEAKILAQAGEVEAAIDALDQLLSVPSYISVALLRLDPIWDPIRDHPRFQALLELYD